MRILPACSPPPILKPSSSLIFAAHDTSANAMTRCLDVLAKRIDIQQRLREEIKDVFDGDSILDLDRILELPTLDAFIKEVLRMYAPLLSMPRVWVIILAIINTYLRSTLEHGRTQPSRSFIRCLRRMARHCSQKFT